MKLHKALKLRKKLVGEIAALKTQIKTKNSYIEGAVNPEKYSVAVMYDELRKKTNELINLKYVINEANREIQASLYKLAELKGFITFWNEVSVQEGTQIVGYSADKTQNYKVQFDENKRNEIVKEFQKQVDALQEEIDVYNYTTDVQWDEPVPES